MSIRDSIRPSIWAIAVIVCGAVPQLSAQTPGAAANFNDSVGIFRENATSDWPALFLSPFTYASQPSSLKGLTISTIGGNTGGIDWLTASFVLNSQEGAISWWVTPAGPGMEMDGNGALTLFNGSSSIFISPSDSQIIINEAAVLTDASLLSPLHFARISAGAGSVAGGMNAFASGSNVSALGLNSAAFGLGTTAQGYNQLVIGQYNILQGTGTANTNAADALFIIGNGSSATARSNAFVVNRNGDVQISGKLTAGNGASATGEYSLALGVNASASAYGIALGSPSFAGGQSVAVGSESVANGIGAVALGNSSNASDWGVAIGASAYALDAQSISVGLGSFAGGAGSVALGAYSYADADSAVSLGSGNYAAGIASASMGYGAQSSGFASASIGRWTVAQGLNQFVIGSYNVASGSPHNSWTEASAGFPAWSENDEIVIVGNGTSNTTRSNALTVKKNAATGIGTGIVTTTASQTVVGKYNDTSNDSEGRNHGNGLFVVGMGTGTAAEQRKNAIRVREDGTLLVRPAGDLSMGGFQTGEEP